MYLTHLKSIIHKHLNKLMVSCLGISVKMSPICWNQVLNIK